MLNESMLYCRNKKGRSNVLLLNLHSMKKDKTLEFSSN